MGSERTFKYKPIQYQLKNCLLFHSFSIPASTSPPAAWLTPLKLSRLAHRSPLLIATQIPITIANEERSFYRLKSCSRDHFGKLFIAHLLKKYKRGDWHTSFLVALSLRPDTYRNNINSTQLKHKC